jgi:uncharacterized membrane protein YphA (DoxX/SURF4 family)
MTKTQKIVYRVLLVIVSALFLFSAFSKLSGNPMAEAGFTVAHLPIWFMYFIGIAEVAGAIGLWIPKLQKWAVYGLEIIMVGAVVVTAVYVSVVMALMPLINGIFLAIILKLGAKSNMQTTAPMNPNPLA